MVIRDIKPDFDDAMGVIQCKFWLFCHNPFFAAVAGSFTGTGKRKLKKQTVGHSRSVQSYLRSEIIIVQRAVQLPARQGSVSYTHLRAHETRHDLVCRLLLEK